jgi:drug/metabolite transporter (DMT)-like permease
MREEAGTKAREAIGVLGRLDLSLPGWLYGLWAAALAAAVLGDMLPEDRGGGPRVQETLLIVAIGVACLFATYLALYLSWTLVGAERIEGVQGRYLLPLLALLGLALPLLRVPRATALRAGCALVVTAAGLVSIATVPALAVRAYYLR